MTLSIAVARVLLTAYSKPAAQQPRSEKALTIIVMIQDETFPLRWFAVMSNKLDHCPFADISSNGIE